MRLLQTHCHPTMFFHPFSQHTLPCVPCSSAQWLPGCSRNRAERVPADLRALVPMSLLPAAGDTPSPDTLLTDSFISLESWCKHPSLGDIYSVTTAACIATSCHTALTPVIYSLCPLDAVRTKAPGLQASVLFADSIPMTKGRDNTTGLFS